MDSAFRRAVSNSRKGDELAFVGLLSEERILKAFGAVSQDWQRRVYSLSVTVWVFLSQCLSADHSCRESVAALIAWRLARGLKRCSADTGAYCIARDRLPESGCRQLARHTGRHVDVEAPSKWRWLGHRVLDVDGSTITMPDTPANQAEYPQMSSQRPGCGFPIARIVVVFSLAVGTVLDATLGKYQGKKTGENSLFRTLHDQLQLGDVVLADRVLSGWCDLALLHQQGVDTVVRKHQLRETDFRTGKRLGKHDHLVTVPKPTKPKWMSRETYDSLPDELTLREVRVIVPQNGFRTQEVIVVTTLLDSNTYSAAEIAKLYRRRWQAELNLRSLKIVLQMDTLRCKVPHRVRNEFYMHLTAYNLIRQMLAVAASVADREPWTISFKGTLQTINRLAPILVSDVSTDEWCDTIFAAIATHVVGNRPDRLEPRVRKRRPKNFPLMNKPRDMYKNQAA